MTTQFSIPTTTETEVALDRQQLYALGLQHILRLCNKVWNDYNVHDPGITTLELLCYSLTDLALRTSLPIQDLLAAKDDNAENMGKQFPSARQILTNRPVTVFDYRKLLIDLDGVKNAWLVPAKVNYIADTIQRRLMHDNSGKPTDVTIEVKGVYNVLLQYMDDIVAAADKETIIANVKTLLHENRNLCKDFGTVDEVRKQFFRLCGEFELNVDADVSVVNAEILFQVQQYLAPPVPIRTLDEMLQRQRPDGTSYSSDDIFNGPMLNNGFIDDKDLEAADLRSDIRLSDLINIIMDIDGVHAVRDLIVNSSDTTSPLVNKWVIAIPEAHQPDLDNAESRLVFYKRNSPVVASPETVEEHLSKLKEDARLKLESGATFDFDVPLGKYHHLDRYYSFQNHFPATYGISEVGLIDASQAGRLAQAYQLKGYLLFFDQLMANYLAQLNHLTDLFSTDPEQLQTYFYRKVEFTDVDKIYLAKDPVADFESADRDDSWDRRHRFLDHLLARYAERFADMARFMSTTFHFSPESMVGLKCEFLNNYVDIGSQRGLAYNHTLAETQNRWNSENVSGLEKRLARLLGIRNFSRRNLSTDVEPGHIEVVESSPGSFRFVIKRTDDDTIVMRSPDNTSFSRSAAEQIARATLYAATMPSTYRQVSLPVDRFDFNVLHNGQVVAVSAGGFDTEAELRAHIDNSADYLRLHSSNEGMFVIEPILLRPDPTTDPFLPISKDPRVNSPDELDPYSDRLHIFLPAYGSRFKHMEFRQFAEEIVREETPAHILPRVCWIDAEDMSTLETRYRDWIDLKTGSESTNRTAKLKAFIDILFNAKNVYPKQNLHACNSGEDQAKFLLGQSALGTMEDSDDNP